MVVVAAAMVAGLTVGLGLELREAMEVTTLPVLALAQVAQLPAALAEQRAAAAAAVGHSAAVRSEALVELALIWIAPMAVVVEEVDRVAVEPLVKRARTVDSTALEAQVARPRPITPTAEAAPKA